MDNLKELPKSENFGKGKIKFYKKVTIITKVIYYLSLIFSFLILFSKLIISNNLNIDLIIFINKSIIIITILIPFISFVIFSYLKTLNIPEKSKRREKWENDLFFSILIPTLSLFIKNSLFRIGVESNKLFYISIILSIFLSLLIFIFYKFELNKIHIFLFFFSIVLSYPYFHESVKILNFFNINSVENVNLEIISDKYFRNGKKSSTYYLKLKNNSLKSKVDSSLYKNVEIGDQVYVHTKEGLFGIKWFYVTKRNVTFPETELPPFL